MKARWRAGSLQVPVQLDCRPNEPADPEIQRLCELMLAVLRESAVGRGEWKLLRPEGRPGAFGADHFIIVQWRLQPLQFDVVVVNLASRSGQCRVHLALENLASRNWEMRNLLGDEMEKHRGSDLEAAGLHLNLPGHGAKLLQFSGKSLF